MPLHIKCYALNLVQIGGLGDLRLSSTQCLVGKGAAVKKLAALFMHRSIISPESPLGKLSGLGPQQQLDLH